MLVKENRAYDWVKKNLSLETLELVPLAGDASFRKYYRLQSKSSSLILMESPPLQEPLYPFITINTLLKTEGVRVPIIHCYDLVLGFALLEDLGDRLFLKSITATNAEALYRKALDELVIMQQTKAQDLPVFNKDFIAKELHIFLEWFLINYLRLSLSEAETKIIETTFNYLMDEISKQPLTFIHRDFHSRNLMLLPTDSSIELAIIDFQDAMLGPFAYDLTSILQDCYIKWPRHFVKAMVAQFYEQSPIAKKWSKKAFLEAFYLCGLQRHLKVLGVFSRLYLRDNKAQYLHDLPLTLSYVLSYLETNEKLKDFYNFLKNRVQLP